MSTIQSVMQEKRVFEPPQAFVAQANVKKADWDALNAKAAHMHKSPDELAGMLLEAIAVSDIYDAVLDQ